MSNDQVACHLSGAEYQDRMAWLADLNATVLRDYRRSDRHIDLVYDVSASDRVHEFVRLERRCCPFLEFSISTHEDVVVVSIRAPEHLAASADELLAPYATQESET